MARQLRESRARQICAGCLVRDECARFALEIGEEHGIWGGTTGRERAALLRQSRSTASGRELTLATEAE
jgi:WhiB family transcriptional regulator, redox-sensing transcriptional regulator